MKDYLCFFPIDKIVIIIALMSTVLNISCFIVSHKSIEIINIILKGYRNTSGITIIVKTGTKG